MVTAINVRKVIYGFVWFRSPQYFVRKYAGNVMLHVTHTHTHTHKHTHIGVSRTQQAAGVIIADLNTGYPDTVYRGIPQVKVGITS